MLFRSLALATSNIPWNGPASAVRISMEEGSDTLIVNPTYGQRSEELPPRAQFDLTACGKDGLINMIEIGALEVPEDTLNKALAKASEEIEKMQAWQKAIIAERGVAKFEFTKPDAHPELEEFYQSHLVPKLATLAGRISKSDIGELKSAWMKEGVEKYPEIPANRIDQFFEIKMDEHVHDLAITEGKRVDGRAFEIGRAHV